ncbi:MAG: dCMP deaminase family protein, partial [Candidatus Bathyarchaeia archaeon]
YDGAPSGLPHCEEVGCLREKINIPSGERHELCRGVHAEANALIQAALHGTSTEGASMYCTHQPCVLCAKLIINAKIREVIYKESYPDTLSLELMREAKINVRKLETNM